ncbi:threonylcarbamoyl-AMP synthase [Candidatus Woesearchaeota archaeon]|nr:threonylcarbamoyl-AMP synthase [Candidatus Woesearchaeota archaeon]
MAVTMCVDDSRTLRLACECLAPGGVIMYPTDTAYALGADTTNPDAVQRVIEAKTRPVDQKMASMYADLAMIEQHIGVDLRLRALVQAFLPGPLTIIFQGSGIRIPDHPFCIALVRAFGKPITCTSANVSGKPSPYVVRDNSDLAVADLIIDAGHLPARLVSTIYDLDSDTVLREGPISHEQIRTTLSKAALR